jgi:hypothetical protein
MSCIRRGTRTRSEAEARSTDQPWFEEQRKASRSKRSPDFGGWSTVCRRSEHNLSTGWLLELPGEPDCQRFVHGDGFGESAVVEHKGLSATLPDYEAKFHAFREIGRPPLLLSGGQMADTRFVPRSKLKSPSRSRIDVRLEAELLTAVQNKVAEKGHRNPSAYLRSLVQKDLAALPDDDRIAHLEKVMAANHNRNAGTLRRVAVVQRATYALLDASVKAILSYPPEPGSGSGAGELARSRGKDRYDRVLKAAMQASTELLDQLADQIDKEVEKPSNRTAK